MKISRYLVILIAGFTVAFVLLIPGVLMPSTSVGSPHLQGASTAFAYLPYVIKQYPLLPTPTGATPTHTPTPTYTPTPTQTPTFVSNGPQDGHWQGSGVASVDFDVYSGGNMWDEFKVFKIEVGDLGSCNNGYIVAVDLYGPGYIADNQFSGESTGNDFSFNGTFNSCTSASGTYTFQQFWVPDCGAYYWSQGNWSASPTTALHPDVGSYNSLALDGNNYPHISYYDATNSRLKYAHQDASGWHIEVLDDSGNVGQDTSLALDDNNNAHIGYYDATNHKLKHAYQDMTGWHTEVVTDSAGYISLVLDESGYPHVSHSNDWNLMYSYKDATSWHTETAKVWASSCMEPNSSIELDGNGNPHMSYYGDIWPGVRYTYKDASGWHETPIATTGYECSTSYNSLELDGVGNPYISFYNLDSKELQYAYKDVSGWHIVPVDSAGNVGQYSSLALDGNNYAHISYYDADNGDLKYAYQDASGWHVETVDSAGNVGQYTSLALDSNGNPHISYYYDTNCNGKGLKYAYRDAAGWHIVPVDPP